MDKLALISKMIEIADRLDDDGMIKEATIMDGIMKKVAYVDPKKVKEYEDAHPGMTLNIDGQPVKKEPTEENWFDKAKDYAGKIHVRWPADPHIYEKNICPSGDKTMTGIPCEDVPNSEKYRKSIDWGWQNPVYVDEDKK